MGNNTISQKIDAYTKANLKALKQEEAKTGRKMTKFDIAQYMLQHGKLNKNEYANWMNTSEGFNAQAMTQAQITALRQGNIWGFAGYGGGQESYLDSMTSFEQKTPVEQFNEIFSPRVKLNETVAERKKKAAEIQKHLQEQKVAKQVLHPNEALKEQKLMDEIRSLPEVKETYTELMNDIKFQNMDRKQKTEFLLKTTGQKFYEAKERGDKEAMKEYLTQGFGLVFAVMDEKAGITDLKEAAKKYSGLNALVDAIDKFVDDGDDANLSFGEKTWETIKGVGDAVDGFIGTQGAAFVGTLAVAGEAAAAAGIGKVFALGIQAYFGIEGVTMVVDGAEKIYNAETKEEVRTGGQEVGTGAIMLGGTAKSVKQGYKNYKAKLEDPNPTRPSTYRDELPTPDYSKTRQNFPADAHKSLSKAEKARAYTTDGTADGIVYQGKDGKMYVPNKWDPEHPYEVSTGADGKPASVIMIYNLGEGDFAVGDPTTIASTYKNPATGKLDPLYNAETGIANAIDIVKYQVPSAYKLVKPGTEIQTKEGPRVVQDGEIVVYDTDGDPYVMPKENFLEQQEPLEWDPESKALYAKLKNGEAIPDTEFATDGNATKTSAKTFVLRDVQLRTKLTELKGPDGKPFLTESEVNNLIQYCQEEGYYPRPIPNYEAKIEAVLNNPEEVASILGCENRSEGIFRAITKPSRSTVEANSELFGVKSKANVGNSSIEHLKAFFENPKYKCMSDLLKNKDILTNNDVFEADVIFDAYGDKTPVIITKIPLKTELGTIPAGSQLTMDASTLVTCGRAIDSNVSVSLRQVLKNGEWGDNITIHMSNDKATITQLEYIRDKYYRLGSFYLSAFSDLAAIIAKSAKTTVEANP